VPSERVFGGQLPEEQGSTLKITAQMTIVIAAFFAIICYGVAITGFSAIGEMTDPAQAADARGFAWFWVFLGSVAVALGAVSLWIVRTPQGGDDV
jgi:hypothetical protein